MRTAVAEARFPLAVPSAAEAESAAERIGKQLDDYLLPRIRRLDAPLLVVVGGSTGAGKSTLVNSIVQAPVSSASVLRPTTRSPVLVSNPADTGWFTERHILPGLNRAVAAKTNDYTLQVISAPALQPGLALLDAPDIDSVVDANRECRGGCSRSPETGARSWRWCWTGCRTGPKRRSPRTCGKCSPSRV
jgi:hypothetical protein